MEMGVGTHLAVVVTGDGGGATSTYAVAMVCADDVVTWHCHVVVVIRRFTIDWGQSKDMRQWGR